MRLRKARSAHRRFPTRHASRGRRAAVAHSGASRGAAHVSGLPPGVPRVRVRPTLRILAACLFLCQALAPAREAASAEAPAAPGDASGALAFRGVVLAGREITVRAPTSARLHDLRVAVGDSVKAGDVLARLDVSSYRQDRAMAFARWERLTAELRRCESAIDQLERARNTFSERIRQGEAVLESLDPPGSADRGRGRTAAARDIMRAPVLESVERRIEDRLATARRDQARLRMELARLRSLRRDLGEGIAATRVAWRTAEEALAQHASIKAPVEGVISLCEPEAREVVQAGSPLFRIMQTDRVRAMLWIPARQCDEITVGATVRVRQDDPAARWYSGTVASISAQTDPRTGQYLAEVEVPNGDSGLQPGRHVSAYLEAGSLNLSQESAR
ncbi:MAG: HlyD family efflux transporter periplasmic adaptor subunit [Planctomycetes bacterium]|nr:HlyD family efflux transporter periplasmic adaptor subunit [Planctomycetota bacterium]